MRRISECFIILLSLFILTSQHIFAQDSNKQETIDQQYQSAEQAATKPDQSKFYATYSEQQKWEYGSTFLGFLAKNKISEKTYYKLAPEDKELVADIKSDSDVFILRDAQGNLLQAFLSLNADTQVRIDYDFQQEQYTITILPIISLQMHQKVVATIEDGGGPSSALYAATQDPKLNQEFIAAYKTRHIVQKGDRIAISYFRKYRLGKPIGSPDIEIIAIESNKKFHYLFGYKNRYYDIDGKEMANFFLTTPVKYYRISSKFSSGRKHPVLGYKRPHYGVDYAAPTGTPIYAAGDGRISFSGIKGGYGNVVEISHPGGIKTLYAHMSKIGKNARTGTYIRQGGYIGNVGSTGISTGPHLHFGVYKNNKPINPLGHIKTTRSELNSKDKQTFSTFAKKAKQDLDSFIQGTSLNASGFVIIREMIKNSDDHDDEEIGISEQNDQNQ